MRKLKVVEIIPSLNPIGGGQTLFTNLCEQFATHFCGSIELSVIFLYEKHNNFLYEKIDEIGVDSYFLSKKKGIDFKCAKKLKKILAIIKPDIVHTHLATSVTLFLASAFRRYNVIHTVHHMVGPDYNNEFINRLLFKKKIFPVCVGEESAKSLSKYMRKSICFINNGVKVKNFSNKKSIFDRTYDFVCVGSLTKVKNHHFLIDSFVEFHSENPNKQLLIIGDGPLKEELNIKIDSYNASSFIKIIGCVDNVNEYLANSKILLIPSLSEGNPMVINEAICSGTYVIGSDVGGIKDLIKSKNFGVLFNSNNKAEFIKCLKMIEKVDFLEKNRIENDSKLNDYDIERTALKYYELFLKIVKKKNNNFNVDTL